MTAHDPKYIHPGGVLPPEAADEAERESIRAELDGHMEDHFEALRELGYDEREAEERTIAAMGTRRRWAGS